MRRLYYSIKALTPLHVGVGTGLGHIDLPIQREVHTKFPMIPGSAVKGALREYKLREIARKIGKSIKELDEQLQKCDGTDINNLKEIFGCQEQSGRLSFSDMRILLFPVKSLNGIFAYTTSPKVLERLSEDLELQGNPFKISEDEALVSNLSVNKIDGKLLILEEFSFQIREFDNEIVDFLRKSLERIGLKPSFDEIMKRLVILSDDAFNDFVQNYTEVQTHIKIDPSKGTVEGGSLWTEEYLPAETYMYGIIFDTHDKSNSSDPFDGLLPRYMHIGGDITTGKGFVRIYEGGKV